MLRMRQARRMITKPPIATPAVYKDSRGGDVVAGDVGIHRRGACSGLMG
jgi:hypothetical protein